MPCPSLTRRREPALAELLDEPIFAALMASDRVDRDWLEQFLNEMRAEGPGE